MNLVEVCQPIKGSFKLNNFNIVFTEEALEAKVKLIVQENIQVLTT